MTRKISLLILPFTIGMIFAVSSSYGQKAKVISAFNYLRFYGKSPNLQDIKNAKEAIDAATENDQSKDMAKTWLYRGDIYLQIAIVKDNKDVKESDAQQIAALDPDAAWKSNEAYEKLATMEDPRLDVSEVPVNRQKAAYYIFQKGVDHFNAKKFDDAVKMFEKCIDIKKDFQLVDSLAIFNAGLAAEQAGNTEKAMGFYTRCMEIGYGGPALYKSAAVMYQNAGDQPKAVEILKKGRMKYPAETDLLITETNIYLKEKKFDEALENLSLAITKDPANVDLIYTRGSIYNEKGELEKAEADYVKAIGLNGKHFEANYNLGALYFNQGAEYSNKIQEIKDNTKYAAEKKKADAIFEKALPYLEKAHEIDPADKNTMVSLKQLYARMGMQDKYSAINDKLQN